MEDNTLLSAFFEQSIEAFLIVLPNGTITKANAAAGRLFNLSLPELYATNIAALLIEPHQSLPQLFSQTGNIHNSQIKLNFMQKGSSVFAADVTGFVIHSSQMQVHSLGIMMRKSNTLALPNAKITESERLYKQIVELAKEGIWVIDDQNQTIFASKALCDMLGYTAAEMQGKDILYFMDDQDRQIAKVKLERRRQGITEQHDFTFQTKTGKTIWTIINTSPILKDGVYTGAIAVITDVTARKMIEDELLQREDRFKVMVENSYDAILLLDENLLTVYRSPSTSQIMGFKDDERLGKSYLELAHPDDVNNIKRLQQIVIQNPGKSIPITVRARHTDGHYLWFIGVATNQLHQKNVRAIVVNLRDISEKKRAQDELSRLTNRLQLAIRSAKLCIWDWNIKDDKLTWDESMYALYEMDPAKFNHCYQSFGEAVHTEDRAHVYEEFFAAVKSNSELDSQFRIVLPNGEIKHVRSMSIVERDSNGNAIRMVGTNWDITSRIKARVEREKLLAELTERNKALEQFAYIISHNLRAPVANVMSLTDMIVDDELDDDVRPAVLNGLNLSVKKIDQIITDLNNIFQSKQLVNDHREAVVLLSVVNDIKLSINGLILKENVTINCHFEQAAGLFTARLYLYSILYNLIVNAIKYRKTSVAPVIDIESKLQDSMIAITITDNGRGINLERNGVKLFGLYQRFDPSVEGRGIGLYMVKTQVTALGGTIDVISKLGIGSTFKVTLPNNA